MKILKIEFENINSLKGPQEIDFSRPPFTGNSLFAITGPTGSGKSTILDVISLALFNQVPRLEKVSKKEIQTKGAILTRNQKEAHARVTYECKSGIYASLWKISTNRNDNLRDYEMQLFDLSTGKALDLKKSDIPSKNEALIGLNYNQFIKSVLLAQGEFAQFLKAKKEERGELLEKITGTGIYRQLGIRAYQKYKEVTAAIEQQQAQVDLLQEERLNSEQLEALNKSLKEKTLQCGPLQAKVEKLESQLEVKKRILEQKKQITHQEKQKKEAEVAWKKFQEDFGDLLQKHEHLQEFAQTLRQWQHLTSLTREIVAELNSNERQEFENNKSAGDCLEQVSRFIKARAEAGNIEEKLQQFSLKVRNLQKSRDEKLVEYKNLKDRFDREVVEIPFQLNGNIDSGEQSLKELEVSSRNRLLQLQDMLPEIELEHPQQEKQRLREKLQAARSAQQQWLKLEQVSREVEQVKKEQSELVDRMSGMPEKLEQKATELAVLQERLEKLNLKKELEKYRKSFEAHRHQLQDGSPCPLCGALEHPYATELPTVQDGLQEEVDSTAKVLERRKDELVAQRTTYNHLQQRHKELQHIEEVKQEEHSSMRANFDSSFGKKFAKESTDWEEQCTYFEKQIQALEQYVLEVRKQTAINSGLPLLASLREILLEGKELKEQLENLYAGTDIHSDCMKWQSAWREFQHTRKTLAQQKEFLSEKLKSRLSEVRALESEIRPKIESRQLGSIEQALSALLPEHQYSKLRSQREKLQSDMQKINSVLSTLSAQLDPLMKKDAKEQEEVLRNQLQEHKEKLQQISDQCEELRRKKKNNTELGDRIKEIETAISGIKSQTKRWHLLHQLIGDSTGKKFNDFAQDLSLAQLLQLANHRLKNLSDRYRIDKALPGEDDGLVAIDSHMGGQRRSVRTLSGGETFILSLSMALALSDLASRNVEINSLFIDEGFGTLDPETLDQTLDTLEKLQAESSKTIGIISHVDSLKERIATQIRLKRNGQGYSTLEIIG